jgi:lipopolysaccharide biosynthesis glycosyltransferase
MARQAVCLCPDARWLVPALYVATQARTVPGSQQYDVVIFAKESIISATHRRWMDQRAIRFIPISYIPDALPTISSKFAHWSIASLHRLILPLHVAGDYDRILYLDCDTSIEGPLAPLLHVNTAQHCVAAVRDIPFYLINKSDNSGRRLDGFSEVTSDPDRYFNAGVLLINVDLWCEEDICGSALDYLVRHSGGGLRDQPALNSVLDGRYAELSPLWNLQVRGYKPLILGDFLKPVIRHFTGQPKPWMRFAERKGRLTVDQDYVRFQNFLCGTPWENWLNQQWSWADLGKNVRFELIRQIRRRPPPGELSDGLRKLRADLFRRYCMDTPFIDVVQHITKRYESRCSDDPVSAQRGPVLEVSQDSVSLVADS